MGGLSMQRFVFMLSLGALAACGSEKVDLGNTKDPALLGASLTDYAGGWIGYAEAFRWNDGTQDVRLTLDDEGKGVLRVGGEDAEGLSFEGPSFEAAPTDDLLKITAGGLIPGFRYSVSDASITSRRLQVSAISRQVYADFCGGFEPVEDVLNAGSYMCLPNAGGAYDMENGCTLLDADATPIPCSHLMCRHVCTCDAASCSAQSNDIADVELDAALESEGEELEGTLFTGNQRITIRMQRTP